MLTFLKHIFKVQFLLILIAIFAGVYYPQIVEYLTAQWKGDEVAVHFETGQQHEQQSSETLFMREQLSKFNGEDGAPLYLALLGSVYDVSKGAKHYGPGCSYNYFVGRDASVSFVTGEFVRYVAEEADDVLSLKPEDLLSLANWKAFYDKDYSYKGKLVGRFYDATGKLTTYHHKFNAMLEQAKEAKAAAEHQRVLYPDCNIEWAAETGTHVWCTTQSGGKQRDWIGHPRKLFTVGDESFRCACIRTEELDTTQVMLKSYDDCARNANECYYNVD